jgi:hypothetical protein
LRRPELSTIKGSSAPRRRRRRYVVAQIGVAFYEAGNVAVRFEILPENLNAG